MYRTLRNIHLILGLLSVPFLLIYGVSAVQMAHQLPIERTLGADEFEVAAGLQPRPLAKLLMERKGYNGELGAIQTTPGGFTFTITSAGAQEQVLYVSKTGRTHIRSTSVNVPGVLNRLHHFHGFGHESAARNAWSAALALVSAMLLLLGVSGVYLWFQLNSERSTGAWLLFTNLMVAGALIASLRW